MSEVEARRRFAWRLGHGAVFFVFMCLLVIVATLTMFGELELLELITAAEQASPTVGPQTE
jgi:hypothetical protein